MCGAPLTTPNNASGIFTFWPCWTKLPSTSTQKFDRNVTPAARNTSLKEHRGKTMPEGQQAVKAQTIFRQ